MKRAERTGIAELKSLVRERNIIKDGVQYQFESSDKQIDLVSNFIKNERLCGDFFDFNLNVAADTGFMLLTFSVPEGTKAFIEEEIGFQNVLRNSHLMNKHLVALADYNTFWSLYCDIQTQVVTVRTIWV